MVRLRGSSICGGETETGSGSAPDPQRAEFVGVLVDPLAGDPEPLRDLLRVEPRGRLARSRAQSLFPEYLDDARDDGAAESVGDLLDHCRIELETPGTQPYRRL